MLLSEDGLFEMRSHVYVGIGSNVNNPIRNVKLALKKITNITSLVRQSSLYRSKPLGFKDQPLFINSVCEVYTELNPWEFLKMLNTIENQMGRLRTFPNAPRIIDLDIIIWMNLIISTPTLQLPHPEMFNRGFVIEPLLELSFSTIDLKPLKSNLINKHRKLSEKDRPIRLYN